MDRRGVIGRVMVVAVLAAMLAAIAVPAAPAATEGCVRRSTEAPITRLAGATRYDTAVCVSQWRYADGASTVLIARGDSNNGFPDALAGIPLAHAWNAPVLLTARDVLPTTTRDEIVRLGAQRIRVLGGSGAVADSVLAQLRDLTDDVARIAGANRYETAAAIADRLPGDEAFLVDGTRAPDALAAGAAAARSGAALLLTAPTMLPDATRDALQSRREVTIVGGDGVVSPGVERAVERLVPATQRLSGPDRYETAAAVARVFPGAGTIHVVGGQDANLVDALAAGWLAAGPDGGPVVYSERAHISRGTDRFLRLGPLRDNPTTMIIGGTSAVSTNVEDQLEARYAEARAGGPAPELRGLWVHLFDDSLKTRAGVRDVLDAAVAANLNTVVVQVARRHDAFYDSDVLPATTDEDWAGDFDLLAELVPDAHARGLQVHAWFSVMPTIHKSMLDEALPADHIHRRHGPDSADPWMATVSSTYYDFMDPAIPGVQTHVTDMLVEVVERYDVDGVHLDYLRYEGIAGDQEPARKEHPTTMRRYEQTRRAGETMADFLRAQTQDLARRIYVEVADVDPSVLVSAALIAQAGGPTGSDLRASFEDTKAYRVKAQDWRSWIDEGIVDHAYPMTYFRESDSTQATWFHQWADFAREMDTSAHVTALGQAAYLNCPAQSNHQIAHAQRAVDGALLYSYQGDVTAPGSTEATRRCPTVRPGDLLGSVSSGLFATPAAAPAVPRKSAPVAGHAAVTVTDGTVVTLTRNGETHTVRADATGVATAVWLRPGTWTVSAPGYRTTALTVTAGGVARRTMTPN